MKTKENLKAFKFLEELQTIELPSPPFYMRRQITQDQFNTMADGTTYKVLSDPVTNLSNKRKHVFCECKVCGYRRHIKFTSLKIKSAICDNCFKVSLEQDAAKVGLTLIGDASHPASRTYQFNKCKHTREVRTEDVRLDRVFCRDCLFERVQKACKDSNYTTNSTKENCGYRFTANCNECGFTSNKSLNLIGKCSNCIVNRVKEAAAKVDAEYVKYTRANHALFKFSCGHEQDVAVAKFEKGNYECKSCLYDKYKGYAKLCNVEIDLNDQHPVSRKYMCKLPCGCSQYVRMDTLERGRVYCEECLDRSQTRETDLYLFKIESKGYTFLKLGISIDPDERLLQYKLDPNSVVNLLATVTEPTWFAAVKKEKALHKKFKDFRLNPPLMKNYMVSGFTECYPEVLEQKLRDELNKIKEQYGS